MLLLVPFSSCCCYKFWLPVPPAAAEAFAAAAAGPWMGNTMAVKDGEAPKLHHVTSETTAEAFATAAAGPRIEKHHGKNHLPTGKYQCLT